MTNPISPLRLLALFLLLTSIPALSDVHASIVDNEGWFTFTITCDADDDYIVTCDPENGQALVNGIPPTGDSQLAVDVDEIIASGGPGDNQIDLSGVNATNFPQVGQIRLYGYGGHDTILGSQLADEISGGPGVDQISGNAGADYILGGPDNDTIFGCTGNDWIDGEDGNDIVSGDCDDDDVFGGLGDDFILAGTGLDNLYGGDGRDSYYLSVQGYTSITDPLGLSLLHFQTSPGPVSVDVNADGDVDGDDFLTWQSNFSGTAERVECSDFSDECNVDGDDFLTWQSPFTVDGGANRGGGQDVLNVKTYGLPYTDDGELIQIEGCVDLFYYNFEVVNFDTTPAESKSWSEVKARF